MAEATCKYFLDKYTKEGNAEMMAMWAERLQRKYPQPVVKEEPKVVKKAVKKAVKEESE